MERSVRRDRGVESLRPKCPDWLLAESDGRCADDVVVVSLYIYFSLCSIFGAFYSFCCYTPVSLTALFSSDSGYPSLFSFLFCAQFTFAHYILVVALSESKRIMELITTSSSTVQCETRNRWQLEKSL